MLETQPFNRRIAEGVGRSKHKLRILKGLAQTRKDRYSFTEIARLTGVRKKQGLGSYLTELVDAGCLRKDPLTGSYSFFMNPWERRFSIHTAHITESFKLRQAFHAKSSNSFGNWMWRRRHDSDLGKAQCRGV